MNTIKNKAGAKPVFAVICLAAVVGTALPVAVHAQVAAETGIVTRATGSAVAGQQGTRNTTKVQARQRVEGAASESAEQGRQKAGGPNCTGETASPGRLVVPLGKSTLMRLPEAITGRTVGNPGIVQAMMVSPETLYLLGLNVGTTNMIIQGRSGACTVIDVVVDMDASGLEATLRSLLPDEKEIKVTAAADSVVLSGTVADAIAIGRTLEIANAFVRRPAAAVQAGTLQPIGAVNPDGTPAQGGAGQRDGAAGGAQPGAAQAGGGGGRPGETNARIINLLGVRAPQQVMLEVKVAEVSKTLLDKLGVGSALQRTNGSWTYSLLTNFLTGTAGGILDVTRASGNNLTLEAEKRDGLIRILAEPTLMAISGQEGRFLAGGTIFIPVSQTQNNNGGGGITLEEKDFGVKLTFTPTVLSEGRINLRVHPEVSELSREGVGISAVGVPGRAILPLITKRNASTTVQLNDGQSFAIRGLIKNNSTANIKALPILGEIPVLGALFRSTDFQEDKTELLFVVTPRLVKPLPANYSLPTDHVVPPDRGELFLGGRLEGRKPDEQSRAPAQPVTPAPRAGQAGMPAYEVSGFELK